MYGVMKGKTIVHPAITKLWKGQWGYWVFFAFKYPLDTDNVLLLTLDIDFQFNSYRRYKRQIKFETKSA